MQGASAASSGTQGEVPFPSPGDQTNFLRGDGQWAAAGGGAGGGAAISAGASSQSTGTVIFSNSNGLTFGLNAGTMTGSYTVPSVAGFLSNINVSAGTTSNNLSAFTFSNASGISFGLNGSVITGTVQTNYLTTAMQSNAATISNINVSAGTTSNNLSALTFNNANGVSFGLNGSAITGSIATTYAGTGFTSTSTNGSDIKATNNTAGLSIAVPPYLTTQTNVAFSADVSSTFQTLTFQNSNGISFSNNAGAIRLTHGLQFTSNTSAITSNALNTSQSLVTAYAFSNTTQSSTGTMAFSSLQFAGAGIASVGVTGGSVVISVPAGGGAGDGGVFAGVSNVGNTAGSTGTVSTGNFVLVGSNGITLSQSTGAAGSAATVTIFGDPHISSFANAPNGVTAGLTFNPASGSHGAAFVLPLNGSFSYLRIIASMAAQSTTLATIASATASASNGFYHTFNAVAYSLGTGGSSRSLISVASGSGAWTFSNQISITNTTQASYTQGITIDVEGLAGGTSLSTQYSVSNTNYSFTTDQIATRFSAFRFIDIPFANSLKAGAYWMLIGYTTSTASAGAAGLSGMTNCFVKYSSHLGISNMNNSIGVMGSTNSASGANLGGGNFTTAGGGTTSAFPISAFSNLGSQAAPYFQLLRQA